jgi:hypothetical protein
LEPRLVGMPGLAGTGTGLARFGIHPGSSHAARLSAGPQVCFG